MTRRGLTPSAVLPISLVLLTRADDYIDALTRYRYDGPPTGAAASEGVSRWVELFIDATEVAVAQAAQFAAELSELRAGWYERLAAWRIDLVEMLPEVPVMTTRTVQRLLDLSFPGARSAVEELAEAGVVVRRSVERGTTGYLAMEVFDLLTFAERGDAVLRRSAKGPVSRYGRELRTHA